MKLQYDIDSDSIKYKSNPKFRKLVNLVTDFNNSNHANICLEFEDLKETHAAYNGIRSVIIRKNYHRIIVVQRGRKVYIIRQEVTNNGK